MSGGKSLVNSLRDLSSGPISRSGRLSSTARMACGGQLAVMHTCLGMLYAGASGLVAVQGARSTGHAPVLRMHC